MDGGIERQQIGINLIREMERHEHQSTRGSFLLTLILVTTSPRRERTLTGSPSLN